MLCQVTNDGQRWSNGFEISGTIHWAGGELEPPLDFDAQVAPDEVHFLLVAPADAAAVVGAALAVSDLNNGTAASKYGLPALDGLLPFTMLSMVHIDTNAKSNQQV